MIFLLRILCLSTILFLSTSVYGIKFLLPAQYYPNWKCIWNSAHENTLVIVTANVGPGDNQRVDVEIVDSSPKRNVYTRKKGIKSESRLAITTHSDGEIGVCFTNTVEGDISHNAASKLAKTIDLDVDIGADAVDYNAIANQESLSGLETEMRKIEGIIKEIVEEMDYLKRREERFTSTNTSTNQRVQTFAWFSLVSLTGLGVWQILHLRAYFKSKYLID